jgi:glycosyltransferase involved in cell wall biosynthesis
MTSGSEHLVSVVMATYNRAALLDRAIESVLAQTFSGWELIVVDDGSSDDTFGVVDRFVQRHRNIRYMRHRNRKAPLARNAGIQASFGRYVTFLDSDDRYLPEHLASRLELLESTPELDLVSGGFVCIGDPWVRDRHDPGTLVHVSDCILCGTMFGRRELFLELGGFRNLDYAEDSDLWDRATLQHNVLKIELPASYLYQRSEDGITSNWKGNNT